MGGMMKILKAMLFSTVFLTGIYESSASLSPDDIEGILGSSSGRAANFLRRVHQRVDPSLFARFQSVLEHGQSAPQQIAALKGVLDTWRAEEAQSRLLASGGRLAAPALESLATSVSRTVVVTSPPREREDGSEGLPPLKVARESSADNKGSIRGNSSRSAPLLDPEVEGLTKAHLSLRRQILELGRHYEDLSRQYKTSMTQFQEHQKQEGPLRAALAMFPQKIGEKRAALSPLLQKETEWRKEVQDAYGTWGIALLNGEDTSRQAQELEAAMQRIYKTMDPEAQEIIDAILASPDNNEKEYPCPLPELFRRRRLLQLYRESVEGKPAFSTTLQTPEIQRRFKIVGALLPTIVEFNQALFEHLAPAHLDFENITAKSSAVAKARDEALGAFLKADNFEERKKALQKKNYSNPLSRIIEELKNAASNLEAARAQKNSAGIREATEKLTSVGLPLDVLKGDEEAISLAIESQCDEALAQIALESFKETALPRIYEATMKSLEEQWKLAEKRRQQWIVDGRVKSSDTIEASVKDILAQNTAEMGKIQSQIQSLEAEEVRVREELSRLQKSLRQEEEMLQQKMQEEQAVGKQLEELRRQETDMAARLEAPTQKKEGAH